MSFRVFNKKEITCSLQMKHWFIFYYCSHICTEVSIIYMFLIFIFCKCSYDATRFGGSPQMPHERHSFGDRSFKILAIMVTDVSQTEVQSMVKQCID